MDANLAKVIVSTLILPPAGPLLLALLGLLLRSRLRKLGLLVGLTGLASLWLLSCSAVAVILARGLLPQPPVLGPQDLQSVQALVVVGGGVVPRADEYGAAQLTSATLARLRYGVYLARRTGMPLGFAGGVGWAMAGTATPPEGTVAAQVAATDYGVRLRWLDSQSRDTVENARNMRTLMKADGIERIALISDSWHLPRAQVEFERAGFQVVPAPTRYPAPSQGAAVEWLPSASGLELSHHVVREWLGLLVQKRVPALLGGTTAP
ncbi:MAG TPA: YdcF family protein [Ramlibacter sp.]|nr:YdcF family protein [Ramlibacter sp.]